VSDTFSIQLAVAEARCVEYFRTRDEKLRDTIVGDYQWLVRICAHRMRRPGEHLDDLVQVANIGLLQALERFDPGFGVTFRTFASSTITGVLRRHYRTVWRIKVPRRLQEMNFAVSAATQVLSLTLHRTPTTADLATYLNLTEDQVTEAMQAGEAYWPGDMHGNGSGTSIDDATSFDDPTAGHDDHLVVRSLLATLPPRLRSVVYMRFYEELTQRQIAERLRISQVHVSRLMGEAMHRLREVQSRPPQTTSSLQTTG
jgi:RNA polymerase sigma-B factor